ncbi:MAG: tRNA threonylcarbamoyladenosine dehydratase [Eubacteriaceae bacterium]|nr:tRNA threonylcarbamoyladenosine dehydratase [Eubacteriaceae bacterium]
MSEQYIRTEKLIGRDVLDVLKRSGVMVIGIGGVGGYVCEALARSGIGHITMVDNDTVSESNLNRQIIALRSTLGKSKTQVMAERIHDIDPQIETKEINCFYLPDTADMFRLESYDYIVDAADTVTAKLELAERAEKTGTKIISSMGTGNKLHPEMFEIDDIYNTSVCPLAKVMRKELKARGVKGLKVVYSKERPAVTENPPASIAFVPPAAGMIIAGEVIRDLTETEKEV